MATPLEDMALKAGELVIEAAKYAVWKERERLAFLLHKYAEETAKGDLIQMVHEIADEVEAGTL